MSIERDHFVNALTDKSLQAGGIDKRTKRVTVAQRKNTEKDVQRILQGNMTWGTPITKGTPGMPD